MAFTIKPLQVNRFVLPREFFLGNPYPSVPPFYGFRLVFEREHPTFSKTVLPSSLTGFYNWLLIDFTDDTQANENLLSGVIALSEYPREGIVYFEADFQDNNNFQRILTDIWMTEIP